MHGTCALPAVCHALATVETPRSPFGLGAAGAVLLAGCHDGAVPLLQGHSMPRRGSSSSQTPASRQALQGLCVSATSVLLLSTQFSSRRAQFSSRRQQVPGSVLTRRAPVPGVHRRHGRRRGARRPGRALQGLHQRADAARHPRRRRLRRWCAAANAWIADGSLGHRGPNCAAECRLSLCQRVIVSLHMESHKHIFPACRRQSAHETMHIVTRRLHTVHAAHGHGRDSWQLLSFMPGYQVIARRWWTAAKAA